MNPAELILSNFQKVSSIPQAWNRYSYVMSSPVNIPPHNH